MGSIGCSLARVVVSPIGARWFAKCPGTNTDPTPAGDLIEAVLEVLAEYLVFGIGGRFGPVGLKAPHQSGNSIRGLQCLIAVTFRLEQRLDKPTPRFIASIHALRNLGDQF